MNPKDRSKAVLQFQRTDRARGKSDMLRGVRGFSEWLPTVQHSSSSAERNEKLMGLIKEKQKDIILLLKDQFFFLIRMMINTLRI